MMISEYRGAHQHGLTVRRIALVCVAFLSVSGAMADPQINRSRPPAGPPPSSGGQGGNGAPASTPRDSSRTDGGRTTRDSSSPAPPRSDRGRTPEVSSRDSASGGSDRGRQKSLDRFSKSNEAAASKGSLSSSHVHYGPSYPFGYFPGGYYPGSYDPYGYPPNSSYPYPDPSYPYPVPRDRSVLA